MTEVPPGNGRHHLDERLRLVEQLRRYVDVDSTTGRERAFLEMLEADFLERGYRTRRQPVADDRWNLIALPVGRPKLLFSTHVDTVPPFLPANVVCRERDGVATRVAGRGACDTKGGLVAMMEAADRLDPERGSIGFLLVVGEEVDHIGAATARDQGLGDATPAAIILCEPTTGNLVAGQKGILKIDLRSRGEAAHSAFPHLGRDALGPLLDTLQRLREADYPTDDVLGPTTVNIGVVEAGVAANVIPAEARAEVLYRVVSDLEDLTAQVRACLAPGVELAVRSVNPALKLPLVSGFSTEIIAFNTDAFYLAELAPVYLMGPGDIRVAHGVDEHIRIDDLVSGVGEYVRLVRALRALGVLEN